MNIFPYALCLDKNFKKPPSFNTVVLVQTVEKEITRTHQRTNSSLCMGDLVHGRVLHHLAVVKGDVEKTDHVFVKKTNVEFYLCHI